MVHLGEVHEKTLKIHPKKINMNEKPPFSRQEIIDGIREIYQEFCDLKKRKEGLSGFRLHDFEEAIEWIEENGLPD
jgi:rubrerythrin